jgi:hypothetical protein
MKPKLTQLAIREVAQTIIAKRVMIKNWPNIEKEEYSAIAMCC